jgi:hypothetical protein
MSTYFQSLDQYVVKEVCRQLIKDHDFPTLNYLRGVNHAMRQLCEGPDFEAVREFWLNREIIHHMVTVLKAYHGSPESSIEIYWDDSPIQTTINTDLIITEKDYATSGSDFSFPSGKGMRTVLMKSDHIKRCIISLTDTHGRDILYMSVEIPTKQYTPVILETKMPQISSLFDFLNRHGFVLDFKDNYEARDAYMRFYQPQPVVYREEWDEG